MTAKLQDNVVDLIVIGSGAAGLSAALTAAKKGATVRVFEATDLLGGTTSCSGAVLWVPFNRWQETKGIHDTRSEAEAYVRDCIGSRADDPRWSVFFDKINYIIDAYLIKECGLSFDLLNYPDAYGEWKTGRTTRHISPSPFSMNKLGSWAAKIRKPVVHNMSLMSLAYFEKTGWIKPTSLPKLMKVLPSLLKNILFKRRAMGEGLIAGLVHACLKNGVQFSLNSPVEDLYEQDGLVSGVFFSAQGKENQSTLQRARLGVVIASGGFSWDKVACKEHLSDLYTLQQDPPTNTGANLRLTSKVGAKMQNLDEAWYLPTANVGDTYMGTKMGRAFVTDRMLPHQIWVNQSGQRFVNEAGQNAAEALRAKKGNGRTPNLPCFSIFDQQYRDRYPVMTGPDKNIEGPEGMVSADTLAELAAKIGVNEQGLQSEIASFNFMAKKGRDTDFGRGEGAYEQYFAGKEGCLGTIEKAPFFAIPVFLGGVGTKGGPATDDNAQVLAENGDPIPGLYAAGNAAAAFNGPITIAAGCTITPALVMGHMAALHASNNKRDLC